MSQTGFTKEQLLELETLLASGAQEIEYDNHRWRGHAISELWKLRNQMRKELGLDKKRITCKQARFSKTGT